MANHRAFGAKQDSGSAESFSRRTQGSNACVGRVAKDGHPGLARSMDCAAQWVYVGSKDMTRTHSATTALRLAWWCVHVGPRPHASLRLRVVSGQSETWRHIKVGTGASGVCGANEHLLAGRWPTLSSARTLDVARADGRSNFAHFAGPLATTNENSRATNAI
jgi:hypothetical protein